MLEDIRGERIKKLDALKKTNRNPYPSSSGRDHLISEVLGAFILLEESKKPVVIAGRIFSLREHGGIVFADLFDGTGKIQILFKKDALGEELYDAFMSMVDIGDFIDVSGICFVTKRGEKTIEARAWSVLTKALLPLPEKWHGLQNTEERYRKRYLDILMNDTARDLFQKKARFWKSIRDFMHAHGFMEVETPILEASPGGADAEPFITHLNALDIDLYLRISPELSLKRLLVAGFDKIFEIGRIFRNEGIDREHLQDYTQLEFYWAYANYQNLKPFVEALYKKAVIDTLGTSTHTWNETVIDWGKKWEEYDYFECVKEKLGIDLRSISEMHLRAEAKKLGLEPQKHLGRGRVIDLIFKKAVRPYLIQPGFLINPPIDIEPLAKRMSDDPSRVERIQVVACGTELGKGFSELNDPIDQRTRMEEQVRLIEAGDKEAQRLDEGFIEALEYGMPPAAGFGLSERFFSIIMNESVRETTFFPLMRPHKP
ncbi:MAG: lysine--tRNA ligase [Patescibacteria group bacterium]